MNKTLTFLLLLPFFSCEKSNQNVDHGFEKAFLDSVALHHYKAHRVAIAPDWEATGYFNNSALKAFHYTTKPEIGFISNRVYISDDDQIEKFIYRTCLPDYSKKSDVYKLIDSIFEVNPNRNQIIRFAGNKAIDTLEDANRVKLILKQIMFYKAAIKNHYKRDKYGL